MSEKIYKPKNPHFAIRIPAETMNKLKYIAYENGRSANKEIEQLILKHIANYEEINGEITQTDIDRLLDNLE